MNVHTIIKHTLIIHGPNMNLLGHRKIEANPNITLDKLNRNWRKVANSLNMKIKIIQTNDETAAGTILQRQRNKTNGFEIHLSMTRSRDGGCCAAYTQYRR